MEELLSEILIYMKEHAVEEITIEEIAAHFGYSKYYFSREFKRMTGFSAADYLSSVKIEYAKQEFLKKNQSITDSSFASGFSSLGTFSTTFAKKTGLSPREYKNQVEALVQLTKVYDDQTNIEYVEKQSNSTNNQLTVHIHYPENYKSSITFVGLFHTLIPNHKPVVGAALVTKKSHTFKEIPNGQYYLLACSIEQTSNLLKHFILDDCLRGKAEQPLSFPNQKMTEITICLREAIPEDPPILINLPKLLADTFHLRNP